VHPYPIAADAFVDAVQAQIDAISGQVRDRFGTLSPTQLSWQPGPGRWGVGQCLVHMARTNELYRASLAPAIQDARARGRVALKPLRGSWVGRWFAEVNGPDGRARRTPPIFRPRRETVDGAALETFFSEQVRLQDLLDEARGIDLDRVRVRSPVSPLLRFHACDAFRILVEHEKRHYVQAERVLSEPSFPE
jgi:DinB superfamily